MPSKPFKLVKGKRIRATRLDGCGRPVYGESSVAVSNGTVSVAMTLNTTDTDAIEQTNMNGDTCVSEPAQTKFSSYSVVLTFCEVDPELFSLLTGQRVYLDADGNAIGFAVSTDVSLEDQGYALEVWAGVSAGSACDTEGAQGSFGYLLLPYLKGGVLGDHTIENGSINFTVSGATTRDGNRWLSGPFNVMLDGDGDPAPLITPLQPNDHELLIQVGVAPPEAYAGTRPLMDPDSTPVTAVVAAEGGSPSEADFTFTGAAADVPVWIDFGDGTWDYVADGTDGSSHTYLANGVYTVKATSNGIWHTTTVTIPFP
jgi:hypothetical protein